MKLWEIKRKCSSKKVWFFGPSKNRYNHSNLTFVWNMIIRKVYSINWFFLSFIFYVNSCDVSERTLAFVYLHFNESLIDTDTRANYARNFTNKRSTLYQEMNEWIDSREWNHRFLWVQTSARLKPTVLWSRIADNNTILSLLDLLGASLQRNEEQVFEK